MLGLLKIFDNHFHFLKFLNNWNFGIGQFWKLLQRNNITSDKIQNKLNDSHIVETISELF